MRIVTERRLAFLRAQFEFIRGGRSLLHRGPAPVIVCGTGGSGTSLVARILQKAGLFMGTNLNHQLDALEFRFLMQRIGRYLAADEHPLARREIRGMARDLEQALVLHRSKMPEPSAPWGFKNPRWIFLLPVLFEKLPSARFIQVVRDGRDMAFSRNQRQLAGYGDLVLKGRLADAPTPVRSIALWSQINLGAMKSLRKARPGGHFEVRFEDLCTEPSLWVGRMLDFVGVGNSPGVEFRELIQSPSSIGRWKAQDPLLVEQVVREGRAALEEFGYL